MQEVQLLTLNTPNACCMQAGLLDDNGLVTPSCLEGYNQLVREYTLAEVSAEGYTLFQLVSNFILELL